MKTDHPYVRGLIMVMALALALPVSGQAQVISLKTVPIAAGDQFQLFPSTSLGMGGVSIALDDPLLDPFVNPGKGGRLQGARLFASPSFYSVTDQNGAGRSLPAGALLSSERWFGGVVLTLQELEAPTRGFAPVIFGPAERLSDRSANNTYAFAMLGRRFPESSASVGASIFWAGLDRLEGVDLLYAGAEEIEQSGHLLDLRFGIAGELEGERSYEILLLHTRLDMTHDVTYFVGWVDPVNDVIAPVRLEENLDRTNTWGLHVGYVQPLAADGWQIGGIVTGNLKSHPKIPNYDIMNIPRDPGDSWAFNFGIGLARTLERTSFGIDLIFEPIWSETWAEAVEPIRTRSGRTIKPGEKTVDNDFRFTNALIRMGLGWEDERLGFQLGLHLRSIDYTLEQTDLVAESQREQDESWKEWTPTWGLTLKFSDFQIRYNGRLTSGTGRPGIAWTTFPVLGGDRMDLASDFIVAPAGDLTLQESQVLSNQVSVMIPID